MKKVYLLEDLDCAHCAQKIEKEVAKLDGVSESKVTFLTQKLTVEVEDEKAADLFDKVKKIVKKFEPDVTVIEK
ncbi:MAG: cation transporter [Lachnospiraceae bacterium]|nr:cation transporter [Lachnospiraceae bacterium]